MIVKLLSYAFDRYLQEGLENVACWLRGHECSISRDDSLLANFKISRLIAKLSDDDNSGTVSSRRFLILRRVLSRIYLFEGPLPLWSSEHGDIWITRLQWVNKLARTKLVGLLRKLLSCSSGHTALNHRSGLKESLFVSIKRILVCHSGSHAVSRSANR